MPRVRVRGVNLYFEQRGEGPPILCLPGALGSGTTDFGPQLEAWSEWFTVIASDPRGYGRSRPPERDFPADFFRRDAEDMVGLMAAIGYERFVLGGWSDGATAVLLAGSHPERVIKLVIWGGNSIISAEDVGRIQNQANRHLV